MTDTTDRTADLRQQPGACPWHAKHMPYCVHCRRANKGAGQQPGVCPECKGLTANKPGQRYFCEACKGTGQQPAQPDCYICHGSRVIRGSIPALDKACSCQPAQPESGEPPEFMGRLPEVIALAHGAGVHCAGDAIAHLQSVLAAAQREPDEVSAAIGRFGVRYMDPPDGGDVTLGEQVSRMANELTAAQQREAELRVLEALLFDGYSVLQHLAARDRGRTSGVNVADTLDALNRAWKAALANKNTVDNLPNGNLPSGDI